MGIQKITQKISSAFSQLSTNKKLANTEKIKEQALDGSNKLKSTLEGMAAAGKTKVMLAKSQLASKKAPSAVETNSAKFIKESMKKGVKVQEAINGTKELMAATKMQEIPKSAKLSADIFIENGETATEKALSLLDKQTKLKAELIAKHVK